MGTIEMNAKNNGLRIRYFSDDQVKKIHANAIELLETHGFMVEHQSALEMLAGNGAQASRDYEWNQRSLGGALQRADANEYWC